MFIALSGREGVPVYEEIAGEIKRQLFVGELQYGEELPSVRVLAELLQVNMHTVRHAYLLLEQQGLVTMRVGRGTRIAPRPAKPTPEVKARLLNYWRQLEQEAFLQGMDAEQLLQFIREEGCHA